MPDSRGNFHGQGWDRAFGSDDYPFRHLDDACAHTVLKFESHSQIRYCAHCGVDVA
jgi:hypothetical protein